MSIFDAGTNTSTAVTSGSIPQWISDSWYNLYNQANDLSQNPYQVYQGPQVASLTPQQLQAMQLAGTNVGNYQPSLTQAGNMFNGVPSIEAGAQNYFGQAGNTYGLATALSGNVNPYLNTGSSLLNNAMQAPTQAGLQAYMNPYQNDVINSTMAQLNQQFGIQDVQNAGVQAQAGAFGGSRAGLQDALTKQFQGMTAANTLAQLNSQNYSQALNQYNAQQGVNLQGANTANAQGNLALQQGGLVNQIGSGIAGLGTNYLQAGGLLNQTGTGLANLGTTQQQLGQADVASLMGSGAVQQGQTQTSYNTAYQNFLNQIQWPYQQLGFASSILQGAPAPASSTTTQTTPTSSTASQLLGLGIGSIGALGKLGVI